MFDSFDMKFVGLDELIDAMSALPETVQDRVIKSTNQRLAREYIINRLKPAIGPYGTRAQKSLGISGSKTDKTAVWAGATNKAFWVRFLDLGAVREKRGTIQPQNIIGPIIDQNVGPLSEAWGDEIGELILQTIEKRIKAGKRKLAKL